MVEGNTSATGGGIGVGAGTLTVGAAVRITRNTADDGKGGGISALNGGNVSLEGSHPSASVIDNCHENCVAESGVISGCAAGGACAFSAR